MVVRLAYYLFRLGYRAGGFSIFRPGYHWEATTASNTMKRNASNHGSNVLPSYEPFSHEEAGLVG